MWAGCMVVKVRSANGGDAFLRVGKSLTHTHNSKPLWCGPQQTSVNLVYWCIPLLLFRYSARASKALLSIKFGTVIVGPNSQRVLPTFEQHILLFGLHGYRCIGISNPDLSGTH